MNKKERILITGANGFIGKSLSNLLNKDKYEIFGLTRKDCDICILNKLEEKINEIQPDYIINAAICGGRLLKQYSATDFFHNILMVENLLYLQNKYNFKIIHFGSGAKEDRTKDILNLNEGCFFEPPNNFYSLSKYFTAQRLYGQQNLIVINIFNCFGHGETSDRFISTCLWNYINKQPIEIWGDKFFDFFYINDLVTLIEYYIKNSIKFPIDFSSNSISYQEINAVYREKYKLSSISSIINSLDNYKVDVIIKDGINRHYTGDGSKLAKLNLNFIGLKNGIIEMYNQIKNEK